MKRKSNKNKPEVFSGLFFCKTDLFSSVQFFLKKIFLQVSIFRVNLRKNNTHC